MSDNRFGLAIAYITSSQIINTGECNLHLIHFIGSGSGVTVSVYEGLDSSSGRLIAVLGGHATESRSVDFKGVQCDRGIYIALGTGVTNCTVIYDTQRFDTNP